MPTTDRRGRASRAGRDSWYSELWLRGLRESSAELPQPWPDRWPLMVLDVATADRRVEELIAALVEVQGAPYPRWRILFRLRSDAPASSALVAEIDQHQWLTGVVVMDSDSIRWQNDLATTLSQGSRSGIVYWQLDAGDFLPAHALRLAAVLLRATPSPAGAAQAVFHVPRRRRVRQIPRPLLPVLGSDGDLPVPLPLPLLVERREAEQPPGKPARGR